MPTTILPEVFGKFETVLLFVAAITTCAVSLALWFDRFIPSLPVHIGMYFMYNQTRWDSTDEKYLG